MVPVVALTLVVLKTRETPSAGVKTASKRGRRSSAEVAYIHKQIAVGRVVEKRGGQIDDDIESFGPLGGPVKWLET